MAELDARISQLRHQLARLPELHQIEVLQAERRGVDDQARDARILRDDLAVAQRKADKDVEAVRQRRARDQQRLDSGLLSNPKDLQSLQHELASLDRRIGVLEDEELEVMEQLEEAERSVASLEEQVAGFDTKIGELQDAVRVKRAEIEGEITSLTAERPMTVEGLPADLLALYDKLHEQKGIGAAELRARQCGGCRISLDPAEINRIRKLASDEVVRCEECSRILVRTAESGL